MGSRPEQLYSTYKAIKCPVCGRQFIPAAEHVYRDKAKRRLVCSYGCMRQAEKEKREMTAKQKPKKEPMVEVRQAIAQMLRETREQAGLSVQEVAEAAGVSVSMASRWASGEYNFTIESLVRAFEAMGAELTLTVQNGTDDFDRIQYALQITGSEEDRT